MHAADQARRVGPDGREDLSLAAAFEIGRLLAVSQPAVVAGLLGWRQDGYAPARIHGILTVPGSLQARLLQVLEENRAVFSAGSRRPCSARSAATARPRLGPVRPLGKPGPDLGAGDLASVVAQGFGIGPGAGVGGARHRAGRPAGSTRRSPPPQLPAQLGELTPGRLRCRHGPGWPPGSRHWSPRPGCSQERNREGHADISRRARRRVGSQAVHGPARRTRAAPGCCPTG